MIGQIHLLVCYKTEVVYSIQIYTTDIQIENTSVMWVWIRMFISCTVAYIMHSATLHLVVCM